MQLQQQFEEALATVTTLKELEALKVQYLGRKGFIVEQMALLRTCSPEEKPAAGKRINDLKCLIDAKLSEAHEALLAHATTAQLAHEALDTTLPGRRRTRGSTHPLTQLLDEIVDIFVSMGFSVERSPEIDTDYYNFEVLNFHEDHPARDMQDTFYIEPEVLLRTHTTNLQGHVLERTQPPVRLICPGVVYRNETISSRSHVFFHQVDGVYIDEGVTLRDMMATLSLFLQKLLGKTEVRFRPSYFPFVEPGCEVDVSCLVCQGKGCPVCKRSGWLEILGAGMVHPQVLRNCGLDPEKYTGFAWGLGVERLVMLRYGINDIRLFAENDLRFLAQFPGV